MSVCPTFEQDRPSHSEKSGQFRRNKLFKLSNHAKMMKYDHLYMADDMWMLSLSAQEGLAQGSQSFMIL